MSRKFKKYPGNPTPAPEEENKALRDSQAARDLRRHKGVALGLLVGMAVILVIGLTIPNGFWARLLRIAGMSGLVGGIADWFAVTALFRHPLGLPVPHTAIIVTEQKRLGDALGTFVAGHLITEEYVFGKKAGLLNPSLLLISLLGALQKDNRGASILGKMLPTVMKSWAETRLTDALFRAKWSDNPDFGRFVADFGQKLVDKNYHQMIFDVVLQGIEGVLNANGEALQGALTERVKAQGGRLIGFLAGESIAKKVLNSLSQELAENRREGSPLRLSFDRWLREKIQEIMEDDKKAAAFSAGLVDLFSGSLRKTEEDQESFTAHPAEVLEKKLQDPQDKTAIAVSGLLGDLSLYLKTHEAVRENFDRSFRLFFLPVLPLLQDKVAGFISASMASWDKNALTERLELRIGKHLQYIRLNGTVVGSLVGVIIYLIIVSFGFKGML